MESAIIYLLQSAAGIAILVIAYRLFFAGQVYFGIKRGILLAIIVFGFTGPFVASLTLSGITPGIPGEEFNFRNITIRLAEITITPNMSSGNGMLLLQALLLIYFTGAVVFLFRFFLKGFRLYRIYQTSEKIKRQGMTFVLLEEGSHAFSFFNLVFLDKTLLTQQEKAEQIISHERIHIGQVHSADILLAEMLIVMQWFNPFAYLLKKAIVENNEFQADRKILERYPDVSDYKLLLLKNTLPKEKYFLTNNFSYSLIKKRFNGFYFTFSIHSTVYVIFFTKK